MIRSANLSYLICCAGSIIFLFGFSRGETQKKSERMFFYMILSSAVMFAANAADSFYNPNRTGVVEILLQMFIYLGFYSLLFFYTYYLVEIIREQKRKETAAVYRNSKGAQSGVLKERMLKSVIYSTGILCFASSVLWINSIFTGSVVHLQGEIYTQGPLYLLGQAGGLLIVLSEIILLLLFRREIGIRSTLILITLPLIPIFGAVFEMLFPGPSVRSQCIFLSILIIFTYYHKVTQLELERNESALLKSRIELMTGRMQPHYLYNVLSTIYYLCEEDPLKAQEAIGIFSEYLRDVLIVLQSQEPVTLAWEREELYHYLTLEKLRFGDRLKIEYESNVDESKILVPPLSVQPLVENAIRHGMEKQDGCVRIRIESRLIAGNPDKIQILVKDDGVGYEPDRVQYGEGLLNVQERLRMQCGGTLNIRSSLGEGTVAEILLPQ